MRRIWFRLLVVFSVLPVLVLGWQGPAAAADRSGDAAEFEIVANGGGWEGNVGVDDSATCNGEAYWTIQGSGVDAVAGVNGSVVCTWGWNGGLDLLTVTFTGQDADYVECSAGLIFSVNEDEGALKQSYGGIITEGDALSCHLTEMCWYTEQHHSMGGPWEDTYTDEGCMAKSLGPMGSSGERTCTQGTFSPPTVTDRPSPTSGTYWKYFTDVALTGSVSGTGTWERYVVYQRVDGGSSDLRPDGETGWEPLVGSLIGPAASGVGSTKTFTAVPWTWAKPLSDSGANSSAAAVKKYKVVGVGIYHRETYGTASPMSSSYDGDAYKATPQDTSTVVGSYGVVGVTRPDWCAFYWGPKIASTTGNDYDEPITDINYVPPGNPDPPTSTPTAPDDSGCDFSFTDPGTWLSGGMCALVGLMGRALGLLGDILGAIGSLVANLIAALGDLLQALFVPDGDLLQGHIDDLRAAVANSNAGGWQEATGSLGSPPAGGSCTGPSFNIDAVGVNLDEMRPFQACSGAAASAASTVRMILGVVVVVGGVFKILSMIMTGLGVKATGDAAAVKS